MLNKLMLISIFFVHANYSITSKSISKPIPIQPDLSKTELRWDWTKVNYNNIRFPKNFLFGFGTSEYQISGADNCPDSNWAHYEKQKKKNGKDCLEFKSGKACDHWNVYKKDIALLKQFKINSYRFSIEWSNIEPQEGVFDRAAIKHYHDLFDLLKANNITPFVTLHHFTHPQWFENLGGFEREKNIQYFVRFCKVVFNEYKNKAKYWVTFNEPGVYVFQGYMRGVYPPGKTNTQLAGKVTRNILRAHVNTYNVLRAMEPSKEKAQIGIVHNITQFEPFNQNNKLEKTITYYLNHTFFEAVLDFFKTDKYKFKVPIFFANVKYEYKDAKSTLDFFGLNYYSHVLVSWKSKKPQYRDGEIATDMPYGIYAEGMYRAINQASKIGVPIYITENGIADAKDNRRELFLKQYLYAVSQAIKDGYDVRGYFYWSLLDNFEWDMGYDLKFGLFEVDLKTRERKLRKSGLYYKQVLENHYKRHNKPPATDKV